VLHSETPQHITASRARARSFESLQSNTCLDGLRPREIGRVEARAKQGLRPADPLKGSHDV
jgi:hypothetical protein